MERITEECLKSRCVSCEMWTTIWKYIFLEPAGQGDGIKTEGFSGFLPLFVCGVCVLFRDHTMTIINWLVISRKQNTWEGLLCKVDVWFRRPTHFSRQSSSRALLNLFQNRKTYIALIPSNKSPKTGDLFFFRLIWGLFFLFLIKIRPLLSVVYTPTVCTKIIFRQNSFWSRFCF